jgi:Domain of unknown function (DUF5655)
VADLAKFLAGRTPELVSLCQRIISTVERYDDVRVEVSPKVVVLHGANRIFGSVRPAREGLSVHLNLPYRVEDRRLTLTEPLTKKLTFHRFLLASPDDLDQQFETWINEARDAANSGR